MAQQQYKTVLRWRKRLIINHSRIINLLVLPQRHEIPTGHKSESWKTLIHIGSDNECESKPKIEVKDNRTTGNPG